VVPEISGTGRSGAFGHSGHDDHPAAILGMLGWMFCLHHGQGVVSRGRVKWLHAPRHCDVSYDKSIFTTVINSVRSCSLHLRVRVTGSTSLAFTSAWQCDVSHGERDRYDNHEFSSAPEVSFVMSVLLVAVFNSLGG